MIEGGQWTPRGPQGVHEGSTPNPLLRSGFPRHLASRWATPPGSDRPSTWPLNWPSTIALALGRAVVKKKSSPRIGDSPAGSQSGGVVSVSSIPPRLRLVRSRSSLGQSGVVFSWPFSRGILRRFFVVASQRCTRLEKTFKWFYK